MKKMKYAKIALAAIISAALLQGGTALAKKKGELSVYEWGPWAVMARPAAGPQFVSFTPKDNPDPYHPTPIPVPPVPPPTPPPVVDHYAGWATYSLHSSKTVYIEGEDGKPVAIQQQKDRGSLLASFVMSIQPTDEQTTVQYPDLFGLQSGVANIKASYTVDSPTHMPPGISSLDDLAILYPRVVSPEMPGVSPGVIYDDPNGTFTDIQSVLGTSPADAKLKITPFYAEEGVVPQNTKTYSGVGGLVIKSEPWNLDMVVGAWSNRIEQDNGDFEQTNYEPFIYGTTTSTAAIDGLQAGNVTVHYTGTTLANQTSVAMTINFGNGTWSGSWNGGVDGANVQTYTDSLGVVHATGHMGFNAAGHLSGSNLTADRIFATDATSISGVVENAVFGNKAQMVGGGYQITKTVTGRYENATQADITIAVDQKLVDLAD